MKKVDSMVRIICKNGDIIIGKYKGIDIDGVLLGKNTKINYEYNGNKREVLMKYGAHVYFSNIDIILNVKEEEKK